MNNKIRFIYKITNTINNKIYIGQHYGYLDDGYLGSGTLIRKAIKKYGRDVFKREILEICKNREHTNQREAYYVNLYNPYAPNGYNIAEGGQGGDTISNNPNREEIIRKVKLHHADFSGKNHPKYGTHHSEQTKKKIGEKSKLKKGYIWVYNPITKETKGIQRDKDIPEGFILGRGDSPLKGISLSEETKQKISESKKGKKQSLQQRQNQTLRQLGCKWWTNGIDCKFCKERPGKEWKLGRIIKKKIKNN